MLFLHVSRIYLLYLPKIGIFYIFNRVVTNNFKKKYEKQRCKRNQEKASDGQGKG